MSFWELDATEPVIRPEAALAYYSRLMPHADLALPDLLIATFQASVLDHLASRLEVQEIHRWPTPVFFPLGRADLGSRQLSIARLPIGAPAAVSALELMIAAGVRTVFLVGSAGSIQPDLPSGSLIVPSIAIRHDGTSHHYLAPGEPAEPSAHLVQALRSAAAARDLPVVGGAVWTTDAPYRECTGTIARLRGEGVLAVEMEAAALFAVARHRGADVALIAAISDELGDGWTPAFHALSFRRALLTAADVAISAARTL